MKFAKELEQELVPEWRIKYLDYKAGKKCVKAVTRAIGRANAATPVLRRSADARPTPRLFSAGSPFSPRRFTITSTHRHSNAGGAGASAGPVPVPVPATAAAGATGAAREDQLSLRSSPAPLGRSSQKDDADADVDAERQSLTATPQDRPHYGSIMHSSRMRSPSVATDGSRIFELPAPALRVPSHTNERPRPAGSPQAVAPADRRPSVRRSASVAVPASSPARTAVAAPYERTPKQRLRRMFSAASGSGNGSSAPAAGEHRDDIDLRVLDEVRERELDFFRFLDGELDKVEGFYKLKEAQAGQRLALLREQLHEMRNRRIEEIQQAKRRGDDEDGGGGGGGGSGGSGGSDDEDGRPRTGSQGSADAKGWDAHQEWLAPLRARIFRPGPNSKALQKMPQTPRLLGVAGAPGAAGAAGDGRRDYMRRRDHHDIPYRTAKRKLKLALQEFYRGLELLKAYALLNRTAFRKLNKKYDKAVGARPPYRYMNEKVNRSWFVNSTVVDDLIVAVEDLYARYFERGNHKIAAGKLRALTKRPGDESGSAFRNGLLIGVGAVFAVQGVVDGAGRLFDPDPLVREQTSYLLQIYGGYFLMLYLLVLFCLDCRVWTLHKVNYPFIFEFDPRSHLDWRQLAQFPSFFFFVFGLFLWLNFSGAANHRLLLYYPVVLIGFTAVLLFFPAPTLWHRSRKWFLYSHWRLFFAGLYPVEFRDFFLGDMYCSLTYSVCNIELFFCLYAHAWNGPARCNSAHSRLLGFFSTLPPIWRLLQCLRRYRDTRNVFPHLVNGGKYTMTILSAMALSLYRIQESHSNLALFITFSAINSCYTSFWDLFMDFSLLQAGSRHVLLRDILALKRRWPYYAVMVVDPLLRFSWIFYAIFTHDTQHNSICSFLVAFAEVTRRGLWALFRVENEHCANVAQYKASRDVPLPYDLHSVLDGGGGGGGGGGGIISEPDDRASVGRSTGIDGAPSLGGAVAGGGTPALSSIRTPRNRPRTGTVTSAMVEAWPEMISEHAAPSAAEEGMARPAAAAAAAAAAAGGDAGDAADTADAAATTGSAAATTTGTMRRRLTSLLAEAHKQDFEKKRRPGTGGTAMGQPGAVDELPSSDEEDDGDEDGDDTDDDGVEEAAAASPGGGAEDGGGSPPVRGSPQ